MSRDRFRTSGLIFSGTYMSLAWSLPEEYKTVHCRMDLRWQPLSPSLEHWRALVTITHQLISCLKNHFLFQLRQPVTKEGNTNNLRSGGPRWTQIVLRGRQDSFLQKVLRQDPNSANLSAWSHLQCTPESRACPSRPALCNIKTWVKSSFGRSSHGTPV